MSPEDRQLWNEVTAGVKPLRRKPVSLWEPVRRIQRYFREHYPPTPQARTFLDLHGMTIETAFVETNRLVSEAHRLGLKHVMIVTGRSGAIRREFPTWMAANPVVRQSDAINGGGAFKIFLKRRT